MDADLHISVTDAPTHSGPMPQRTFDELARQWKSGRNATSTVKRMVAHPAYRQIIEMGTAALPGILAELQREPDHWFVALHEITQADPVPESSRGKLAEMAAAWIAWGREHSYPCTS